MEEREWMRGDLKRVSGREKENSDWKSVNGGV
jgi:hypothetical protein